MTSTDRSPAWVIAARFVIRTLMADVINLNRARKRKRLEAEREQAERNRVAHGRGKLDKQLAERERERAAQLHAGHELDDLDEGSANAAPPPAPEQTDAPEQP
jgi:hypothetical protein